MVAEPDGLGGGGGGGSNSPNLGTPGGNGKIFIRIPAAAGLSAPDVTIAPGSNSVSTLSPSGDILCSFAVTGTVQIG